MKKPNYRAFNINDKELYFQTQIRSKLYFVNKRKTKQTIFYIPFIQKNWILSQSINYKDIKKRLLYTGDIISVQNSASDPILKYYIDLDPSGEICAYAILDNKISQEFIFNFNILLQNEFSKKSILLLGNAYENPELLQTKKIPKLNGGKRKK